MGTETLFALDYHTGPLLTEQTWRVEQGGKLCVMGKKITIISTTTTAAKKWEEFRNVARDFWAKLPFLFPKPLGKDCKCAGNRIQFCARVKGQTGPLAKSASWETMQCKQKGQSRFPDLILEALFITGSYRDLCVNTWLMQQDMDHFQFSHQIYFPDFSWKTKKLQNVLLFFVRHLW